MFKFHQVQAPNMKLDLIITIGMRGPDRFRHKIKSTRQFFISRWKEILGKMFLQWGLFQLISTRFVNRCDYKWDQQCGNSYNSGGEIICGEQKVSFIFEILWLYISILIKFPVNR